MRRVLRVYRANGGAAEVDEELRFHIERRIEELAARGMALTDARAQALREFGDWERHRREVLSIDRGFARRRRWRELGESVWADISHSVRALRARPGFVAVTLTTLALGIGATTAVFSAVNGVLLRPLPYVAADRIVHIGERSADAMGRGGPTSYENFDDWARLSHSFAALGIVSTWAPTLTGHGDPVRVPIAAVSSGIFDVFHVAPYLGRRIAPMDSAPGSPKVVLLSYQWWQTRFGGDSNVVGQTVSLDHGRASVIGVLPLGFVGPGRLARPIWSNYVNDSAGRDGRSNDVYALVRPGATIDAARAEMTQISGHLASVYPQADRGQVAVVDRLVELTAGSVRQPLVLLLAASALVLMIACANLSNVMLARGMARKRELVMRSALGADRGRIVRLLFTESALLGVAGAVAGLLLAQAATATLRALGPSVFNVRPPALDWRVMLVTIGLTLVTILAFGLGPARRNTPRDTQSALRETDAGISGRSIRGTLAVAQLALAVVLLSASALVLKSFARVLAVDPGIRTDRVLSMQLTLPAERYDGARSTAFYETLEHRLAAMPDVKGVAVTSLVPLGGDFDRVGVTKIAGQPERSGSDVPRGDRYVVSPSYFRTMGVRLREGRLLSEADRYDSPLVCVVDERFAQRAFGDGVVIGQRMALPLRNGYATIVGVVSHVKTYGLDATSPGQIYLAQAQYPWRWSSLVVWTTGDPIAFGPVAARAVHEIDPDQAVDGVASMGQLLSDSLRERRFTLVLLGAFAMAALILGAVGLYGVIAYGVAQRRKEFGVRLAVGARRSHIARLVLSDAGRLTLLGAMLGLAGALATARLIGTLLFEVDGRDIVVLASVLASLGVVAFAASVVPAYRAMRVDASEVLRGA